MGIFSRDYESAGVGIAKNAPKKTGIKLFFDILGRKVWKLFQVNMLYSLFYLPLILSVIAITTIPDLRIGIAAALVLFLSFMVLIGPATAGMTKVMRNYVLEKHSFIIRDFFKAFKQNFGKACVIGIIDVLVCLSVFASFQVYPGFAEQTGNNMWYVLLVIGLSVSLVAAMMNFYIFLMLIATDLSLKNLFKNSFALAFVAMKTSFITFLLAILLIGITAFLVLFVHVMFLSFLPFFPAAFVSFIICFNCYPVIQKYVINPYYTIIGKVNPELIQEEPDDEEPIFRDMGGKEKPIEKRKKGKGRRIS